jgi:serine/threonine protein kinase
MAQHLDVDFLPITWHPAVETIGAGATAEIRQALVDVQISFAFKRIGLERNRTFAALASEISLLKNREVSQHDNVIGLLGVCWDVDPSGPTFWPVLVFEKAPFGNLEEFMQSPRADGLSASQLLGFVAQIASALSCLHRNCKKCQLKLSSVANHFHKSHRSLRCEAE